MIFTIMFIPTDELKGIFFFFLPTRVKELGQFTEVFFYDVITCMSVLSNCQSFVTTVFDIARPDVVIIPHKQQSEGHRTAYVG